MEFWREAAQWLDAFNGYCYLRHIELKSGFPGRLTGTRQGGSMASGEPLVDYEPAPPPLCPSCGGRAPMGKVKVTHECLCGRCGAPQLVHSALLRCRTCDLGLCGGCVEGLGLLGDVPDLVLLHRPYECWLDESCHGSLGSSAVVQGVLAAAGCWATQLLATGHRGAPLPAILACCALQPTYDALQLWLSPPSGENAVRVAHLSGFATGALFYLLCVAPRRRSPTVCFPFSLLSCRSP